MKYPSFGDSNLKTVNEALDIAEDKTGDYYKFSLGQWKRHRYDVKTQTDLHNDEIASFAFALLNKCSNITDGFESKTKKRDYYFICLQDHQILKALKRDINLELLPLLVYILTHELVHIVRFSNFFQRFEVSGEGKENEEKVVHETTYKILRNTALLKMDYILESYQDHRFFDLRLS